MTAPQDDREAEVARIAAVLRETEDVGGFESQAAALYDAGLRASPDDDCERCGRPWSGHDPRNEECPIGGGWTYLRAEPAEVAGLREALDGLPPATCYRAHTQSDEHRGVSGAVWKADVARAALAATEPVAPTLTEAAQGSGYTSGNFRAEPPAPESLDVDWRAAVIAVVDACDTELEGGATDDFERGAYAAYNWVLSVIDGNVQVAARLSEGREP